MQMVCVLPAFLQKQNRQTNSFFVRFFWKKTDALPKALNPNSFFASFFWKKAAPKAASFSPVFLHQQKGCFKTIANRKNKYPKGHCPTVKTPPSHGGDGSSILPGPTHHELKRYTKKEKTCKTKPNKKN